MNKIIILENLVIKRNEKYIKGPKDRNRLLGLLSIKHKREIRFYKYALEKEFLYLKTPRLLSWNDEFIVLEKIDGDHFINHKDTKLAVPALNELAQLGDQFQKNVGDYISSPTFSIFRMLTTNITSLGFVDWCKFSFILINYLSTSSNLSENFFIHRDLSTGHNLVKTVNGIFLYDFAESIVTKRYYLADIVGLSIDLDTFTIDYELIKYYLEYSGYTENKIIPKQILLLVIRKYLGYYKRVGKYNKSILAEAYELIIHKNILYST